MECTEISGVFLSGPYRKGGPGLRSGNVYVAGFTTGGLDGNTSAETFKECGERFGIEENFPGDKSNGFGWEESRLRDPEAPGRLVLVTATATLCLSLQGARVEAGGRRTEADPHWFRSLSYFRIGWNWIKRELEHGDPTVPTPRGHLGLRVSVMSFVSQPSKRGWDKSLPLGIVPALDSLVNRVDRTPRNTSNLSNTQEGDHQVLLTKKSIRIQGLF